MAANTYSIRVEDVKKLLNQTVREVTGTQFQQGDVSHFYALQRGAAGVQVSLLEVQVFAETGNTAFSVTVEHTLDVTRGWQVVGTITTAAALQLPTAGGWYRVTVGTATGGNVTVMVAAR